MDQREYWKMRYESALKDLSEFFPNLTGSIIIGEIYPEQYRDVTMELEKIILLYKQIIGE